MHVKYVPTVLATLGFITATGTTVNFTIETKEFDQKDCSTSCLYGLIADNDKFILHSSLKISNIIPIANLILIVEVKTTKSVKFAVIYQEDILVCLNRTGQEVECYMIKEDYFNITIKYNATSKLSEASLKVAVSYERKYFFGNVIQLPHISDTMKSTLLLNNDRLPLMSHKCETDLIRKGSLHFCCEENNIVKTTAIIKINGVVVSKSERCAEIQMLPSIETLTILDFECSFCDVQLLTSSCYYGNDTSGDTSGDPPDKAKIKDDSSSHHYELIIMFGIIMAILILILICVAFICIKQVKERNERPGQAEQESMISNVTTRL
ncbi:uncharacterized protein LOC129922923 [Biomphalaria glabrata]|uniref:Uncharacterized protein LOC129922923 n=1 Tax=Biomphalaria glabrata TaxID=6526 RepID=A0A9W2YWN3_BIOGL|nr:uncharacterized protein LOC129922923 [Biomphalaria glabrata]XP_055867135.1 uncharacterized protein LOC129922923 [Biomphalaria glabrata]XP_055867136.1 uncharacterized protein LOC129922923 [Biomphalaria glabrata]